MRFLYEGFKNIFSIFINVISFICHKFIDFVLYSLSDEYPASRAITAVRAKVRLL